MWGLGGSTWRVRDLASRLITSLIHVAAPVIPILSLLTKFLTLPVEVQDLGCLGVLGLRVQCRPGHVSIRGQKEKGKPSGNRG